MNNVQINGLSNDIDILNCFADRFASIYIISRNDTASNTHFYSEYDALLTQNSVFSKTCDLSLFSVELIERCVGNLKLGKAQYLGQGTEHLVNSQPLLYLHLAIYLMHNLCMTSFQMISV